MLDETQAAILIIIFICVVIFVAVKLNQNPNESSLKKGVEDDIRVEKTDINEETDDTKISTVIKYSDNYSKTNTGPQTDTNHKIVLITKNHFYNDRWLCPNCEVENDLLNKKCCVCNYRYTV